MGLIDTINAVIENVIDGFMEDYDGEVTLYKINVAGHFVETYDLPVDEEVRFDILTSLEESINADIDFELV